MTFREYGFEWEEVNPSWWRCKILPDFELAVQVERSTTVDGWDIYYFGANLPTWHYRSTYPSSGAARAAALVWLRTKLRDAHRKLDNVLKDFMSKPSTPEGCVTEPDPFEMV